MDVVVGIAHAVVAVVVVTAVIVVVVVVVAVVVVGLLQADFLQLFFCCFSFEFIDFLIRLEACCIKIKFLLSTCCKQRCNNECQEKNGLPHSLKIRKGSQLTALKYVKCTILFCFYAVI